MVVQCTVGKDGLWALFAPIEDLVEGVELPDLDRGVVRT